MSDEKKEISFDGASVKESTHLLRLWINRAEAFDMATRILNAMRDSEKEEVGFSIFVKESKEDGNQ